MRRKVDATQGPLTKLIFIYTIPLILTTIMQLLFEIVDKAVLGNMADTTAVASVGATGTITNLIINGFVGLSAGTSIVLARYIGQKDKDKIRTTIDTSLIVGVIFGFIIAIAGVVGAPYFLRLTDCPEECFDGAVLYIRLYIAAAPATLLYNYGSAVLRSLGDTSRPLTYIMISGVCNLVLNIILCLILPQKVAAVAIATAASKIIGAALVMNRLCHLEDDARVSLKRMRFNLPALGRILRFGIPPAINNLIFPFSNLQIVSAINSFGIDAVAGQSAAASIDNIARAITSGFGTATTTFMGQNIGADDKKRTLRSLWLFLLFGSTIGGTFGLITCWTGRFWLGTIVGFSSTAAIDFGMVRMVYVSQFIFIHGINAVLTHALQAYGYPFFGSINSIVFTLGFRFLWMQWLYPKNPTFEMIMACFTVSWCLIMLFNSLMVTIITVRYKRGKYKKI